MVAAFVGGVISAGGALGQNQPPAQPTITEPAFEGRVVNAGDVHMESSPFSDPNPGQLHRCTDWEIWSIDPPERVWVTECIGGIERLHTHLGDGIFENSHEGRNTLFYDRDYRLRVRHADNSGAPNTWGPWAERLFRTAEATQIHPMELVDVVNIPPPTWQSSELPVVFPAASPAAFWRIENGLGQPLFEMRSLNGNVNQLLDFPVLTAHHPLRIRISAGGLPGGLVRPESEIRFVSDDSRQRTIYLPQLVLATGEQATYWIAASGATYIGDPSQTEPDFTQLARSPSVPWVPAPGYRVEVVAGGFRLPVNIAFHNNPGPEPDAPMFYVTELYGTIKVVYRDGSVHDFATNLVNYPPTGFFPGSGEQGLTGIVVQPGTNAVYASMLYEAAGGFHFPKVVRFTSDDGGRTASGQTTILDMFGEVQGQSHQVSNLSFGPDGMLYVHMGDGFQFQTALDLESFRGKVIRVTPAGLPPTDNPFYDEKNGLTPRDYIFAYGFRNPFGGAWRQRDMRHYQVENGPSVDRFAMIARGGNYGYDGTDQSMYTNAMLVWSPGSAPVNIAFIEPGVFGGSGFPPERMGQAFVSLSGPTWIEGPWHNAKKIAVFDISDNGDTLEPLPHLVDYNGAGRGTACALAAGPDGLYFSDLYEESGFEGPVVAGSRVLRIRYVGVCDFHADVQRGPGPFAVRFTDDSTTPGAVAWNWDFGDGSSSTEQNPVHVYTAPGSYNVRLAVTGVGAPVVTQKNAYIEVAPDVRAAFVGGSETPLAWDAEVIAALTAGGFVVEYFHDADPARPRGSELGAGRNLIVVSSTMSAPGALSEFRDVPTPVLFWEQTLLLTPYEGMAANGARANGQTAVQIVDERHPIAHGMKSGRTVVYNTPAAMNVAVPALAEGLHVIAERDSVPEHVALGVVEAGEPLLGLRSSTARRAFIFMDDTTFSNLNSDGLQLFNRAACWAAGQATEFLASPADASVRIGEMLVLRSLARGKGPVAYQWRKDGVELPNATGPTLTLAQAGPKDAGVYEVLAVAACGSAVSQPAMILIVCGADYNADGEVTSQDFFDFLSCFLIECPDSDFNSDGIVNTSDFFDFLTAFFTPCGD